jgi:hypothetical protein
VAIPKDKAGCVVKGFTLRVREGAYMLCGEEGVIESNKAVRGYGDGTKILKVVDIPLNQEIAPIKENEPRIRTRTMEELSEKELIEHISGTDRDGADM